jgi:hypothetical protein
MDHKKATGKKNGEWHQKELCNTDSYGIPPQGASSSSKPMEGGDLKLVASKVGRIHLGKSVWKCQEEAQNLG